MEFQTRVTITADHPSLPGHFPNRPIIPAVVILDKIAEALAEWRGPDVRVTGIPSVKFLLALKPGQPFTIVLSTQEDGGPANEVDFSCLMGDQPAVRGRLLIGSESTL